LADATAAARAEIGAGLKERERLPRKASAQAHRQLAAKKDQVSPPGQSGSPGGEPVLGPTP
jgi:hypothetical protein